MLSDLEQREEALTAETEAMQIFRSLAKKNPAKFEPQYAQSLVNLATRLSQVGRHGKALAPIEEAIELYQILIGRGRAPRMFASRLLSAFRTLADILDGLGRTAEAARLRRSIAKVRG
jgi:tetratricopeptide (TPR) repeat protein